MNEILLNIISVVVSVVVLPLITIAGTQLIKFINAKVKDVEASKFLSNATDIVISATRCVLQTYVDSLKKEGSFDLEHQKIALNKAKEIALTQLTSDTKKFITDNFGSLEDWLITQIEASVNVMKNK